MLLPFLALATAAVLDFARIYRAAQVLQAAATTGALYASGTAATPGPPANDPAAVKRAVCEACVSLTDALPPENVTVSTAGKSVTVTAAYDVPLLSAALYPPGTVRLSRSATLAVAPRPGE